MDIPRDRLTIRFARSGGPGGQNVNKVETKVEVRFHVASADWLPDRVRRRIQELNAPAITREGELVITSSRERSQARNLEDCIHKLEKIIADASRRPRRRIATRPTRASRERRITAKKLRGKTKKSRGWQEE